MNILGTIRIEKMENSLIPGGKQHELVLDVEIPQTDTVYCPNGTQLRVICNAEGEVASYGFEDKTRPGSVISAGWKAGEEAQVTAYCQQAIRDYAAQHAKKEEHYE